MIRLEEKQILLRTEIVSFWRLEKKITSQRLILPAFTTVTPSNSSEGTPLDANDNITLLKW